MWIAHLSCLNIELEITASSALVRASMSEIDSEKQIVITVLQKSVLIIEIQIHRNH